MTLDACPVCAAAKPEPIFALRDVPALCNQLWPDAASARAAPKGDVELAICRHCALVWNRRFDPAVVEYAPNYENALHFSPSFAAFADRLAADLVARHGLRGRQVVEVGCGDGYMLGLMVRHGAATATGFDPSMAGKPPHGGPRDGVEIVPEYFRPDHLDRPVDAILCRHVLEHLPEPLPFLRALAASSGGRSIPIYLEVPNAAWLFARASIWDMIYEHVTYWTPASMAALLRRAGVRVVRLESGYRGQFLMAEGLADAEAEADADGDPEVTVAAARAFGRIAAARVADWRARLAALPGEAVIWGSGSKGVTFANLMGPGAGPLVPLVDRNPRKHGMSIPGAALPIVGPASLAEIAPELVLVANGLYRDEIAAELGDLGLQPRVEVLSG